MDPLCTSESGRAQVEWYVESMDRGIDDYNVGKAAAIERGDFVEPPAHCADCPCSGGSSAYQGGKVYFNMYFDSRPWELNVCNGEGCWFELAEWNEKGYLATAHKQGY